MRSILQKNKRCLLCHTTLNLEEHHVYEGADRHISEERGLKVWLCRYHHQGDIRGNENSVHYNIKLQKALKAWTQKKAMKYYGWSVEDFRERLGRSYI